MQWSLMYRHPTFNLSYTFIGASVSKPHIIINTCMPACLFVWTNHLLWIWNRHNQIFYGHWMSLCTVAQPKARVKGYCQTIGMMLKAWTGSEDKSNLQHAPQSISKEQVWAISLDVSHMTRLSGCDSDQMCVGLASGKSQQERQTKLLVLEYYSSIVQAM